MRAQDVMDAGEQGAEFFDMQGDNAQAVFGEGVERQVIFENLLDDFAFLAGADDVADGVVVVAVFVAQQGLYGEAFFG